MVVINMVATKGFKTSALNERIETVQADNEKLELKITHLKSLQNLEAQVQDLEMEKISRVEYLTPATSTVALAE